MKYIKKYEEIENENNFIPVPKDGTTVIYYKIVTNKSITIFNLILDKLEIKDLFYDCFNRSDEVDFVNEEVEKYNFLFITVDYGDSMVEINNKKPTKKYLDKFYDGLKIIDGGEVSLFDYEIRSIKYNL